MSKKALHTFLLDKSIQAAISAIEIYNKPDFKYREESFSILMVNAWELLLKAKIVKDKQKGFSVLYITDNEQSLKKDGTLKRKPTFKKNRAGNFLTIDIYEAIKRLALLDTNLRENIGLLTEMRDNSTHFFNHSKSFEFEKKLLEIGTATLKSYVEVVREWFKYDMTKYNFFLMPVSFFYPSEISAISLKKEGKQYANLLNYISKKEEEFPSNEDAKHHISLIVQTKFVKGSASEAVPVKYDPTNPKAISVTYGDPDKEFSNKYPWTFKDDLCPKLKERYKNFKPDKRFYEIKKPLDQNEKYCKSRYLDPKKKQGPCKKYYSTEILKELDKHYERK